MRLIWHSSAYSIGAFLPLIAQLLVIPIIIGILGPDVYGIIAVCLLTSQSLTTLLGAGVSAAIPRQIILQHDGLRNSAGIVFFHFLVISAVSLAIMSVYCLINQERGETFYLFTLVLLSSMGLVQIALVQAFYQGLQKPLYVITIGFLIALSPPIVGLIAATNWELSALNYFSGYSITQFSLGILSSFLVLVKFRGVLKFKVYLESIRIGIATVPHNFAASLVPLSASTIALAVGGPVLAGGIQFANAIANAPLTILSSINQAWAPELYRTKTKNLPKFVTASTFLISIIAFLVVTSFSVLAPIVIPLLGQEISSKSVIQLSILIAASGTMNVLYFANINLVFRRGRTGWLAISTPISVLVGVAGLYVLVYVFGLINSIAFASIWFLYFFGMVVSGFLLARKVEKIYPNLFAAIAMTAFTILFCTVLSFLADATLTSATLAFVGISSVVILTLRGKTIKKFL